MLGRIIPVLIGAMLAFGCSEIATTATNDSDKKVLMVPAEEIKLLDMVMDCKDCPPMIRIPPIPGTDGLLFAARHELTWKEYLIAVEEADCPLPQASPRITFDKVNLDQLSDDYPVSYLPPDDFNCYLGWINKATGKKYRLPNSAEWEHLARAGSTTRYPWGDELGQGNTAIFSHYDRKKHPRHRRTDPRFQGARNLGVLPVESFNPNAWGVYDVIGNVAEYVDETKQGTQKCIEKYSRAECGFIAIRGGSKSSVRYRIEAGEPTRLVGHDDDHMGNVGWTYVRLGDSAAQPYGYRLVRDSQD